MGTNYYIVENECKCCDRKDLVHIGKKSWGWAFCFQGYRNTYETIETDEGKVIAYPYEVDLISWENYKQVLKNKKIIDEYGDEIPFEKFTELVEVYGAPDYVNSTGKQNLDHIDYVLKEDRYWSIWQTYKDKTRHWHDNSGYSFSITSFS